MRKTNYNIIVHTAFWLLFLALPFVVYPDSIYLLKKQTGNSFLLSYIAGILFIIPFFYCHYSFAIPKLFFQKKTLLYLLSLLMLVLLFIAFARISLSIFGHNNFTGRGPKPTFARGIIMRLILIIVVPLGLRIYERWKNLERTRIQMELSYLKAQINPHFLFNTLNGIYALAIKKSDNTGDAIVKLSSIMRYVITEAANEKVPLEKEIKYISDFIDLQQLRLSKSTTVNYNVNGNTSGVTIEPLLLITFIENAFKYGVSTEITSSIDIYINMTGKRLQFIVRNAKITRHDGNKTFGVGLKNTIDRLNLSHNKNYSLTIDDTEKEFAINLNINLK